MKLLRNLVLLLLAVSVSGCGYNAIQRQDEAVKAAWSEVLNQYQRRSDLVPNLVNTVKGYAQHEEKVFTEVTDARAKVGSVQITPELANDPQALAKFQAAQGELGNALSRLMVVSENYPNLKADGLFQNLQAQLEGTENRIEIARRDYNAAVQDYNTELVTVPGSLWAATLYKTYKQATPFAASTAAQSAPVVSFPGATSTAPPPAPAAAQPGAQP